MYYSIPKLIPAFGTLAPGDTVSSIDVSSIIVVSHQLFRARVRTKRTDLEACILVE
jgi:hypothetical protein